MWLSLSQYHNFVECVTSRYRSAVSRPARSIIDMLEHGNTTLPSPPVTFSLGCCGMWNELVRRAATAHSCFALTSGLIDFLCTIYNQLAMSCWLILNKSFLVLTSCILIYLSLPNCLLVIMGSVWYEIADTIGHQGKPDSLRETFSKEISFFTVSLY